MRKLKDRIEYQYNAYEKCRLVVIDGLYIAVVPEDLDFWAAEVGLSLTEEEKADATRYLTEQHTPPDDQAEWIGKIIDLSGVKIYRKTKQWNK